MTLGEHNINLVCFYLHNYFQDENENEEGDEEMVVGNGATAESDGEGDGARGRGHAFFQRSDSTLCLGCPPPDPFNSKQFISIERMCNNSENTFISS